MLRNPLVNTLVGSVQIVKSGVGFDQPVDLRTMPDEHVIQTFPFQTANEAFADCIRLGCPNRGP
jgi:hypothetical protein